MEFEKLQMIIAEVLSMKPEEIEPEMAFVDDLGADSLEIFQIVMGIEEEFDIVIEDDMLKDVTTVESALQLISEGQ